MNHGQVRCYDPIAKSFHWIMALLILTLWGIGFVMDDIPKGPFRGEVFNLHKALGVIVLLLAVARLSWRASHAVPGLPLSMTAFKRMAATWSHRLLYVLMLMIPISGILMSQLHGHAVSVFGLFTVPTFLAENEVLEDILEELHGGLAMTLAGLVAIHVAAALQHHFIHKNDILKRMTFGMGEDSKFD